MEIKRRKRGGIGMLLKVISTGSQVGNCYALIADNGEMLLLDAGATYKSALKAIDYRISDVKALLLSHEHL